MSGIVEGRFFGFTVALSLPKLQSFALSADQTVLGQAFVPARPFYLREREKADLAPVARSRSVSLSGATCQSHALHPSVSLSLPHPSLCILHPVLCQRPISVLTHTNTHTHTFTTLQQLQSNTSASLVICVSAWSWWLGEMSCVIWSPPLSLTLLLRDL